MKSLNKIFNFLTRSHYGRGYVTIVATTAVSTVIHNSPVWFFWAYSVVGCVFYWVVMFFAFCKFTPGYQHLTVARVWLAGAQMSLWFSKDKREDETESEDVEPSEVLGESFTGVGGWFVRKAERSMEAYRNAQSATKGGTTKTSLA